MTKENCFTSADRYLAGAEALHDLAVQYQDARKLYFRRAAMGASAEELKGIEMLRDSFVKRMDALESRRPGKNERGF